MAVVGMAVNGADGDVKWWCGEDGDEHGSDGTCGHSDSGGC